ncbi:glucose repression mediator protein [Malassezia equina]|uniref:Glucose repression mediator protein n=1 Tax=Malassezia equina TaxID=1381935 RepID=A0AAF0ECF5_9BASI|nr:glucose repression mediator protein [Malassezia equina]
MVVAHEGSAPPMLSPSSDRVMMTLNKLSMANEQTWIAIGSAAETMSDPTRALAAYDSALLHNPYSIPALSAMASVYRSMDHFDLAVEYIQRVLDIDRENGEVWGAMGHCYLMMEELEKAYTAYQQALCHLPNAKEPKLWYGIGILYDRCGNLEHAEETFSSVVRMNPDYEKANEIYFRLGIIYKQQGRYDSSLECFRYILNNPPTPLTEMDIWFQIGHVHEQRQEYDLAKEAYERVLRENTNHGKVLQQLGALYMQPASGLFDQDKAIQLLHQSIDSDKNDQQTWYLLGRAYMGIQEFNKAYDAYQQAVYRDGKNPVLWGSIGILYFQIGQYHDALGAFSRSIRLNPYIPEIWFNLGILYESCNNQISDAIDAYRRTLELAPEFPEVQQRLPLLQSAESLGKAVPNVPAPKDLPFAAYSTCTLPPSEGSPIMGDAEEVGWSGDSTVHHTKESAVPGADEERKLASDASPMKMKFYEESSGKSPMPRMQYAKSQPESVRDMPVSRGYPAPSEWDRHPYHEEAAISYQSRHHPIRGPVDSRMDRSDPGYFAAGTRSSYPVSNGGMHMAHREMMPPESEHERVRVDKEMQLRRKRDMTNLRRPVSTLRSNQGDLNSMNEYPLERNDVSGPTMRSSMPVSSSREIDEDYDTGAASALMGLAGAAASAYEASNLSRARPEILTSPKTKRPLDSEHMSTDAKRPRPENHIPNGDHESAMDPSRSKNS